MSRNYTSSPLKLTMACNGTALLYKEVEYPAELLSLLHLSSLPSSQPNVLHPLQHTITRRTSGYCLGTLITINLVMFPPY
jgi:hypothetical protein